MSSPEVLITGGLGFVGSNLAQEAVRRGARVVVYDSLDPRSGGNMRNLEGIADRVELIVNDIRSFEGLAAAVRGKELIFNCAAYTSHPQSMTDPLTDIEVNCQGTIHLLEAARRFNPDAKIVHVGTSTQVGRMIDAEVTELHPEFPVDIYSANKTASEKYVLIYGSAYGMRTTVVRLANNYGPRSNIRTPDFGFVNYFVGLALRNCDLTVYGDGAQLRNISFIQDSVEALWLAAHREEANGQVLFAVASGQLSVREIAEAIVRNVGGRLKFVEWPADRQAIEIGDAKISNRKIRDLLGWSPEVGLDDGLRRTKEYFAGRLADYLG